MSTVLEPALGLCDPTKITVPTIIMRGQWDALRADDLIEFFKLLA